MSDGTSVAEGTVQCKPAETLLYEDEISNPATDSIIQLRTILRYKQFHSSNHSFQVYMNMVDNINNDDHMVLKVSIT